MDRALRTYMKTFQLKPGLVISQYEEFLELVTIDNNCLTFEEINTRNKTIIANDDFWIHHQIGLIKIPDTFSSSKELLTDEPQEAISSSTDLASFDEKEQLNVDRMKRYIVELKKQGITRGQRKYIAHELGRIGSQMHDANIPKASTVQRWWHRFEINGGQAYALVNGNALKKKILKFTLASEDFIQAQIDQCYAIRTRPGVSSAYRGYLQALKAENVKLQKTSKPPLDKASERTFRLRIQKRPQFELMVDRYGRAHAEAHFRMVQGHLPAQYPLDVVEVDHSPLDLYVLDDENFLPLGRPWITVMKDRYSGVILGFSFSFRKTGIESIFACLKHSITPHDDIHERWPDIQNPWPAFGVGHYYVFDRGTDFTSIELQTAINSLGAHYEYCAVHSPWLKGSIERFFKTLSETLFETLPGKTFSSLKDRGDYDPAKDAVIRVSTLVYLIHKWACDHHNIFPDVRKQAVPIDLWIEGIGIAPPPYPNSMDELNIILGERNTGMLSQEGIRYKWITYANETLSDIMDQVGKGTKVDFIVNRENLGFIHVKNPTTGNYEEIPSTRPDYACGLTSYQHQYLRKVNQIDLNSRNAIDTLIETRANTQKVIQEEMKSKRKYNYSQAAKLAGISSDAVIANKPKTIAQPFEGQNIEPKETSSNVLVYPDFQKITKLRWG